MPSTSLPQFFFDYTLHNDFYEFPTPVAAAGENSGGGGGGGGAMFGDRNGLVYDHNGGGFNMSSMEYPNIAPSDFRDRSGISYFSEFNESLSGIVGFQNFNGYNYQQDLCDFSDEYNCGFLPDVKPLYPSARDNWEIQGNRVPTLEESNIKVGRYSVEERKDRILKYLKKRNQRNFNKTIKYACRKTLADRRVRVRGRFARNASERCEDEDLVKKMKNDNSHKDSELLYCSNSIQIKNDDDDDWLQEAMKSLMCVPYMNGGYGGIL